MFNQNLKVMKFKNQGFVLLLVFTIFLSVGCSKEKDELVLYQKQAGKLKIEVYQQDNETPVTDQLVNLHKGSAEFKFEKTNSEGKIDFGKVLQGNYTISLKDVNLGAENDLSEASVYNINKNAQVMTDETTKEIINVKDYIGSFYVTVIDRYTDSVYNDANVYLLKKNIYDRYDYFIDAESDIDPYAIDKKTTDDQGMATFVDIPANYSYSFLVVCKTDSSDIKTNGIDFYLETKEDKHAVLNISFPIIP